MTTDNLMFVSSTIPFPEPGELEISPRAQRMAADVLSCLPSGPFIDDYEELMAQCHDFLVNESSKGMGNKEK